MLRNRIFAVRNIQKWAVRSWKGRNFWCSGIAFSDCEIVRCWLAKGVNVLMIRKTFPGCETFRYRLCRSAAKRKIRAVPSCKGSVKLVHRNRVFWLRNVQILAVLTGKNFDLLIHRKCIFRMRNVQICVLPSCKGVDFLLSGIAFSGCGKFI